MFWVDNSSSSYTGNLKNDFLILGEGPTFRINGSFHASEKKIDINFTKVIKMLTLHPNFALEAYRMNLTAMV